MQLENKKDTNLIVQLVDSDDGTRTKPFAGTIQELTQHFINLIDIEKFPENDEAHEKIKKLKRAFILVLSDNYKNRDELDYSHYPLQTVENFIKTNGENNHE